MASLSDVQFADIPRYWATTGHRADLDSNGFLATAYSFTGAAGGAADRSLVATSQLGELKGLILLGPPGSGKSIELARLQQADLADTPVIAVELGSIAGDEDLKQHLHEHDDFKAWKSGTSDLTLFLDSIDEGILSIENLSAFLRAALRDGPGERIRIRVTCRAADWPEGLERAIRSLIGKDESGADKTHALTLMPLRADDALVIARDELGDKAEHFLSEVMRSGAGPLAALPLTLKLLFEVYRQQGQLPKRPAELFEKATLYLCEEANLHHPEAHGTRERRDDATALRPPLS